MKNLTHSLLALLVLFLAVSAKAQEGKRFSVDISGGLDYCHGDINSNFSPAGEIGARYALTHHFSLRADLRKGFLSGSESDFGREFENDYFSYSVTGMFNISKMTDLQRALPNIAFLLYGGVGIIQSNSKDVADYSESSLARPKYTGSDVIYPMGGIAKFYLTERIDLNVNIGYVYSNSDELDNYAIKNNGNRFNDGFSTYSIGLSFKLGKKGKEHVDWLKDGWEAEIANLDKTYSRRIHVLAKKVETLELNVDSQGILIYNNETEIKHLRRLIDIQNDSIASLSTRLSDNPFQLKNRFVTVVGSFRDVNRARTFADKLKGEGYNPEIIYNYGRNWHYVYVKTYDDVNEARKNLTEYRRLFKGAWIYFKSCDDIQR